MMYTAKGQLDRDALFHQHGCFTSMWGWCSALRTT